VLLYRIALVIVCALALAGSAQARTDVTPPPTVGFWNISSYGTTVAQIGRFTYQAGKYKSDGTALAPDAVPWIKDTGGWIKSPSAVKFNDRIYLYFASYDRGPQGWTGIGLAILDKNGRNPIVVGNRPVLERQPGMGAYGTEFPRVIRDPLESDPSARWKMWMSADPTMGYATSPDGIAWTYRGTVAIPASPFNAALTIPGAIVRDGGWWYMFTQEMGADTRWVAGLVRSRNPAGPFERVGPMPLLANRAGETAVLSLVGGTKVATVADASGFRVGEPVYFKHSFGTQLNRVVGINGTTLTLRDPSLRDYAGGTVRTWAWDVYLTDVWKENGKWRGLGTGFHGAFPNENTLTATGSLTGGWKVNLGMPLWPGEWTSAENPVLAR